jgi:hypothetical protein
MLEKFGGKRFEREVEDTLQRLKRAAEARYRSRVAKQS